LAFYFDSSKKKKLVIAKKKLDKYSCALEFPFSTSLSLCAQIFFHIFPFVVRAKRWLSVGGALLAGQSGANYKGINGRSREVKRRHNKHKKKTAQRRRFGTKGSLRFGRDYGLTILAQKLPFKYAHNRNEAQAVPELS